MPAAKPWAAILGAVVALAMVGCDDGDEPMRCEAVDCDQTCRAAGYGRGVCVLNACQCRADSDVIPGASFAVEVNGDLAEWPPLRYTLDRDHLAMSISDDDRTDPAPAPEEAQVRFDLRWTADALYFAASVADDATPDDSGAEIWYDDSVELFVDGDPDPERTGYGTGDDDHHQYIVGQGGEIVDHELPVDAAVGHAVQPSGAGYAIELSVPWSALGGTEPAIGRVLGIDVALNDDDVSTDPHPETYMVMCTNTPDSRPAVNTSRFCDFALAE